MIKCMPIVTANGSTQIAFNVIMVDTNVGNSHIMYGGGQGYTGKKIGEASVIMQNDAFLSHNVEVEVLYAAGYRYDGKDFCVETEKSIIKACEEIAKVIWG